MSYPKIDGYAYHINLFEEFYQEQYGHLPEDERPLIEDAARQLYENNFLIDCDLGQPWDHMSYSAGVYCGEIAGDDDWDYSRHYVIHPHHEPRFINEHTDGYKVVENLGNPDRHADDACDLMEDLIDLIRKHNDHAELEADEIAPIYNALQQIACPQYKIVLGVWNSHLNDEELEKFRCESNRDTLPSYL